jgi:hypothetical protein
VEVFDRLDAIRRTLGDAARPGLAGEDDSELEAHLRVCCGAGARSERMERNALAALASLLDQLGIRWMLIGALAANRYRITTRLTQDVDLLLASVGPGLASLEHALDAAGWSLRRALPDGEILRLRHRELGAADLIVAGTDYERGALARAREERLGDAQEVRIAAPEDVIVLKLIAGRAQDVADIEAILAAKPTLDEVYLEEWVEFWGVRPLWRRVRGG